MTFGKPGRDLRAGGHQVRRALPAPVHAPAVLRQHLHLLYRFPVQQSISSGGQPEDEYPEIRYHHVQAGLRHQGRRLLRPHRRLRDQIGKKEKDDSTIRDVVIYEQNYSGLQDDIIVAEKGKMIVTPDKKSLEFKLQNGSLYREKGERLSTNTEFRPHGLFAI